MFSRSEHLYDAIYSWKKYDAESAKLIAIVDRLKSSPGNSLLDVACGTGGHIPFLRDRFAIEGLDLDPKMLEIARGRHAGIPFHRGDMIDFDLGRRFDVVVSLFSSIGYLVTPERLSRAVANMARHVAPGGMLLIEPFFTPEAWLPRTKAPGALVVDRPEITIVRLNDAHRDGNVVTMTFHYLVGDPGKVEHFTEAHRMALFSNAEMKTAFEHAGLQVEHDPEGLMGRGLWIGTRT